jgi:hypothetical protein
MATCKVVNFESPNELRAMSDTVLELFRDAFPWPTRGWPPSWSPPAKRRGQGDLVSFAEQAAKMGLAFGMLATVRQDDERLACGMGLTLERTFALADAVNHLRTK